jgi:hypothetical protein
MIGYVTLGTNDLERASAFCDQVLAGIGASRMMTFGKQGGERGYAWGASMDAPMLCIMTPFDSQAATVGNGVMAGNVTQYR